MGDAYGLMGHPIAHSRSPFIHGRFALATGEDLTYEAIDQPVIDLAAALDTQDIHPSLFQVLEPGESHHFQ